MLSVTGEERAPPTLAQEERQTDHLKDACLLSSAQPSRPALSSQLGYPRSLLPSLASGLSESPSNVKTGRATGTQPDCPTLQT